MPKHKAPMTNAYALAELRAKLISPPHGLVEHPRTRALVCICGAVADDYRTYLAHLAEPVIEREEVA